MPERFNAKDALADYVTVPQRIAQFYELFGTGRLVTGEVRVEMGPDGKSRVMVQAAAYRTPEDPLPGIGWSWMELPGTTSFTRGSELENTETSAWGRAIAALGILVDRSVASANEVAAKSGEKAEPHTAKPDPVREITRADEPIFEGSYQAAGQLGVNPKPPADGFMRQEPDGALVVVTFTDTDNHKIPQVMVRGSLAADLLDSAGNDVKGLVCEISGDLYRVPWFKDNRPMPPFQRLELKGIRTAGWFLPVPGQSGPGLFDATGESELDTVIDGLQPDMIHGR